MRTVDALQWIRRALAAGHRVVFVVGNHDIEAGHAVYDKLYAEMNAPVICANAVKPDGTPYFKPYAIIERQGVKIAILGMVSPKIPEWLPPQFWTGMEFEDMIVSAQKWVKIIQETVDAASFDRALQTILAARRIYILGVRSSAPNRSLMSLRITSDRSPASAAHWLSGKRMKTLMKWLKAPFPLRALVWGSLSPSSRSLILSSSSASSITTRIAWDGSGAGMMPSVLAARSPASRAWSWVTASSCRHPTAPS